jgi:hypothetical protein
MMVDGTVYIENEAEIEDPKIIDMPGRGYVEEGGVIRPCQEWTVNSYHGHSYESLMTNKEFQPVNRNPQWISVVRSSLNGIPIIIGGEVDCVSSSCFQKIHTPDPTDHHDHQEAVDDSYHPVQKVVPPDQTIELKTSIKPSGTREFGILYRYKMIKFWLQSCWSLSFILYWIITCFSCIS